MAAARQAIVDATWFDKRDINRNFHYDHAAYVAVKHNLGRLVGLGPLPAAMDGPVLGVDGPGEPAD